MLQTNQVIQIDQFDVLNSMYAQMINLEQVSQKLSKPKSFEFLLINKGNEVKKAEVWQDLLLNVASRACLDSYRKIFNHFYPLLVGHGIKSGLSKEVSTELAQEAMCKVWTQAKLFDPLKGEGSLWIFVIARNLKYDYLRKHRNDPIRVSSDQVYPEDHFGQSDQDDTGKLFDFQQLRQHVHKLPNEQQEIIYKIYFEGMTQQEISEENKIPLGTVKSRVRLAISSIKKMMEEMSNDSSSSK